VSEQKERLDQLRADGEAMFEEVEGGAKKISDDRRFPSQSTKTCRSH